MTTQDGLTLDVEDMGMIALAAVVLVPGLLWASGAGSVGGKLLRGGIVAGLLAGVLAVEVSLDSAAETVGQRLKVEPIGMVPA